MKTSFHRQVPTPCLEYVPLIVTEVIGGVSHKQFGLLRANRIVDRVGHHEIYNLIL